MLCHLPCPHRTFPYETSPGLKQCHLWVKRLHNALLFTKPAVGASQGAVRSLRQAPLLPRRTPVVEASGAGATDPWSTAGPLGPSSCNLHAQHMAVHETRKMQKTKLKTQSGINSEQSNPRRLPSVCFTHPPTPHLSNTFRSPRTLTVTRATQRSMVNTRP